MGRGRQQLKPMSEAPGLISGYFSVTRHELKVIVKVNIDENHPRIRPGVSPGRYSSFRLRTATSTDPREDKDGSRIRLRSC